MAREENQAVLQEVREMPCFTCGKPPPSDPHHLTSRGAGGRDALDNLIPLCRSCHSILHQYGLSKFAWKKPRIKEFLTRHKRLDLLNKIHEFSSRKQLK